MLHPMDRARLCSGNDLTAEKLPYVLRPQKALNTAQRMWSNDFERSKLIRFDPMPRHTRYTQRLPFPSSLQNAISTGQLILMLDDARMITAPVVSQRNGEWQTSGLERESLLFRTTIERALKRSSFSSGRVSRPDTVTDAPMSFADSIAVNNKYLLGEDKKAKGKEESKDSTEAEPTGSKRKAEDLSNFGTYLKVISDIAADTLSEGVSDLGAALTKGMVTFAVDTKAGEKSAQEMKNLLDVYDSRTQFASDVKDDLAQSPLTQTMGEGVSKIDQALGLSDESKAYIGTLTAGLPLVGKFRKFVPSKKLTAQLDRLRAEGHALERHGGAITDEQLYARARTGVAPDGSKTRRGYTPTSTAFNSDELLVNADDFLRNNYLDDAIKNAEPGTLRIKVSADTGVELGRGYIPVGKKTGQSGPLQKVNDLTNVEAWYVYDPAKNIWQTNTIYPIPGK